MEARLAVHDQPEMPASGTQWCRACGAVVGGGDPARCGVCGSSLDRPDPGSLRIGRVVTVSGRLMSRLAVAIDEQGPTVTILSKGDSGVPMPVEQFDSLPPVTVPGPPVIGAAGRLWAANQARGYGTVKGRWAVEPVDAAAARFALGTLAARRAAALDAIALGLAGWPERLALSPSELAWYRACFAAVDGSTIDLLDLLGQLPERGYAGRVALLFRRAADLFGVPAVAARARVLLRSFVDGSADARALDAALVAEPAADVISAMRAYAADADRWSAPLRDGLTGVATAVAARTRVPMLPPTPAPALRALDAYLAGVAGAGLDGSAAILGPLPSVLLDDLIAAGALTRLPDGPSPWPEPVAAYLRCRLVPGAADPADLVAVGFDSERARRFFLAGDDAALARLPAGDPGVAHFVALDAYRRTGRLDADRLRPPARRLLELVDLLRAPAGDSRHDVPADVAADPSCWPLIQQAVMRGDIALSDRVRTGYPQFGAWMDLRGIQRLLFEGQWAQVASSGGLLATASGVPAVRAEAQNMVAFAQWRLGRADEALRVLDGVLRERFVDAIAVNAALVAAERGSVPPLAYLGQIMRSAGDPRVRQAALARAIDLWAADDDVEGYPTELAHLVREGLDREQPDDFHRRLLALSAGNDDKWLADATVWTANPVQQDALLYYRTRARSGSQTHSEGPAEVAAALVSLVRKRPRAEWVDGELAAVTRFLLDAVHQPFGEAIGLTSMIEGLVTGDVLPLADRLILSVQAGAHVAFKLNEENEVIAPEFEKRLLLEPLRLYRARRQELPADRREEVEAELGQCVGVAAYAVWCAADRAMEEFGEDWNRLVERLRWDYENRYAISRAQRALVDQADSFLARCRAYLAVMEGLPLTEVGTRTRDVITDTVREWSGETARLRSML